MHEQDAGMRVVHLLRAITLELDRIGEKFAARHALHPTDVRALICLLDAARTGAPATPGTLGAHLGLNSAGTTAVIDRLERLGHVRRERDIRDRRRVLLKVDESAVALGWGFFGPLIHEVVAVLGRFDPADQATIEAFLGDVHEAVTRRRAGQD
ncbi:MarR family winged helix-turn-helix transcriptional regulator [Sphaerimonospora thailandensis]|uniref:Transcriptional regulator n=1 Tax=Sphaerimonospora thailandensis TaxID=795644 RepID=A0A8J3R4S7_9ACTN|nr:MarR family winged helix-turn-helix transcriptional regulator [Sphaerimonospora thailandensis]GIH69097.1 transcriptional regulator [Sphaerimonospora thailandensis]